MPNPLFSIIVATFNVSDTILSCLNSIQVQTYRNWELIIIDGGSTDGTVNLLEKNVHWIKYWESRPDKGVYDAWNKALDHVSGDWVYFLGADDRFASKDTLQTLVELIEKHGLAFSDLICGAMTYVRTHREEKVYFPEIEKFPFQMFPHQGCFHSRGIFQGSRFSEEFRLRGDYEFLVRTWINRNKQLKIRSVNLTVAICNYGGISSSAATRLEAFRQTFRIRKIYSLSPYSKDMMLFGVKSLLKHSIYLLIKREF